MASAVNRPTRESFPSNFRRSNRVQCETFAMKRILVCCLVFSLVLGGCEDDDAPALFDCPFTSSPPALAASMDPPSPPKHPCDFVKAQKNGMQWSAHAATSFRTGSDTLNITAQVNEETLGIRFLFAGVGTYRILPVGLADYFNDNAYFYISVGRDVIIDHYNLLEEGHVQILEYNETENVIKGVFNLPLIQHPTSDAPKTLLFTEGSFSVHLPD